MCELAISCWPLGFTNELLLSNILPACVILCNGLLLQQSEMIILILLYSYKRLVHRSDVCFAGFHRITVLLVC